MISREIFCMIYFFLIICVIGRRNMYARNAEAKISRIYNFLLIFTYSSDLLYYAREILGEINEIERSCRRFWRCIIKKSLEISHEFYFLGYLRINSREEFIGPRWRAKIFQNL